MDKKKRASMVSVASIFRKIHAPSIKTDETGKAKSFRFFSIQRPHMRGLHVAWFTFFIAFLSWFGIQPLLPTISKELGLTKKDLANSGIASVAATICVRMTVGPLCDKFGPRRVMAGLLIIGSFPLALSGLIKNATGLIVIRLFVGILGGAFVPCQFWTTSMFNIKMIGTANAIVGGWGNLGGGVTFLFIPAVFEIVKMCGADEFLAWKITVAVPSFICITIGTSILFTSDDCPQGKWEDRYQEDYTLEVKADETTTVNVNSGTTITDEHEDEKVPLDSQEQNGKITNGTNGHSVHFGDAEKNSAASEEKKESWCGINSMPWKLLTVFILFCQYGFCFGIELAANNVMNLYLLYNFKKEGCVENAINSVGVNSSSNGTSIMSSSTADSNNDYSCSILNQNTASLIASLFGLMNLFARSVGGICSDLGRKYYGIPGRLVVHFLCLISVGLLMILFSQMRTIPNAIVVLVVFSTFVQMTEGTTYALVPYVLPNHIGKVAGFVGAGGNAGAVIWNSMWSEMVETDPNKWFWLLGIVVICGSFMTFFSVVQGITIWSICSSRRTNTKSKSIG